MSFGFRIRHMAIVAVSIAIAAFLFWLASEHRSHGILRALENSLVFLFFVPYVVAVAFGSNAHNPSAIVFFIALCLEMYAVLMVARFIFHAVKRRVAARG